MSKVKEKDISRDELESDLLKLRIRKAEIEQEIALNWRQDSPELIAELTAVDTRLRAAEVVEQGVSEREQAEYEREYLKTFTVKAQEVQRVRNEAEQLTARAAKLRAELRNVEIDAHNSDQKARNLAGKLVSGLERQVNENRITNLAEFFEVAAQYMPGSRMQHWKR